MTTGRIITQPLDPDQVERAEGALRDLASTIINHVQVRGTHPSYGYTKTSIRLRLAALNGAIGLYMVLTEQAGSGVPTLAKFADPGTTSRVETARVLVATM